MILSITITITATPDDRFLAETPGGPIEAGSLRELGDQLRELLAHLEDEADLERSALAQLSRSATDQPRLLELAHTSPPPDSWLVDN